MSNLATPPIKDPLFADLTTVISSKSWIMFFQRVASLLSATIGPTGDTGPAGPANTLTIGTVVEADVADASITGSAPNQVLNLELPKGDKGDQGIQGETGPAGTIGDMDGGFANSVYTYSQVIDGGGA